ncbi:hypothetical protein KM043_015672 [Ampulex compressa]|nr:hypothetical protein KM043_015672 [Ampulex compressa]
MFDHHWLTFKKLRLGDISKIRGKVREGLCRKRENKQTNKRHPIKISKARGLALPKIQASFQRSSACGGVSIPEGIPKKLHRSPGIQDGDSVPRSSTRSTISAAGKLGGEAVD